MVAWAAKMVVRLSERDREDIIVLIEKVVLHVRLFITSLQKMIEFTPWGRKLWYGPRLASSNHGYRACGLRVCVRTCG